MSAETSPFYRVLLADGQSITDFCTSFEYEDSTDKDDMVTLQLSNLPYRIYESKGFQIGSRLTAQWGFIKGKTRSVTLEIKNIEPNFGEENTCTVKALDKGQNMKKAVVGKVWKNVTASQIIMAIAEKHKLTYNKQAISFLKSFANTEAQKEQSFKNNPSAQFYMENPSRKYESLPQGNRTDWEMIQYLLQQEGYDWHAYVKEDDLVVKKRNVGKTAGRSFVFAAGVNIQSFKPKANDTEQTGASTEVKTQGFDMLNKTPVEGVSNPETDAKNTKLDSEKIYSYDASANEIGTTIATGQKDVSASTTKAGADAEAGGKFDKAGLGAVEADMVIIGDPDITADIVVTVNGLPKQFNGNYYVGTCKHTINDTYTCSLALKKSTTGGTAGASSNTSKGSTDTSKKEKVYVYNSNGRQIGVK